MVFRGETLDHGFILCLQSLQTSGKLRSTIQYHLDVISRVVQVHSTAKLDILPFLWTAYVFWRTRQKGITCGVSEAVKHWYAPEGTRPYTFSPDPTYIHIWKFWFWTGILPALFKMASINGRNSRRGLV